MVEVLMSNRANHWLQAARGCASLLILVQWPRVPEPKRWAAAHV